MLMCFFTECSWWQDLSPGSVEEAEEAEPDDEFKDAIEVNTVLNVMVYISVTSPQSSQSLHHKRVASSWLA